ncbi:hypothetical protein 2F1_9 [Uncultured Caudovirales phage clone 2F_1]|uniref:XRE family transcriptional regulator n=1 Tax=Uncultured Caudovirales phage clone 2F_1 TaxID=2992576 RepID=A0A2H4J8M8_9CAUD|nr:helix-turn-helix transcriptional regulator [Acinetobacter radioresistens]YP_010092437.1 hypothetical protein KNT73_gp09 [Uncultured Caudovirales phage clone 2F_1]ASN71610.1 hypothetical protein 2F1_9 [Uncultured Caudovirales phage clone 2F_1]RJL74407.1 XRE family transcriptional regulator [Acinetobacter radioresistens]
MNSFYDEGRGNRLKDERKKFNGLTQKAAAEIAEVKEQAWVRYEKHGAPFDLKFALLLQEYGFDMMYVIFGVRKTLNPEQTQLLGIFEKLDDNQKQKALQMLELIK